MTSTSEAELPLAQPRATPRPPDRRGSPIPTPALIATRFMELRARRGLMIALFLVVVGIPTVFLGVRLILHAAAPNTYGPAGGLSQSSLENWAAEHPREVLCDFPYDNLDINVSCGGRVEPAPPGSPSVQTHVAT